MLLFNGLVMERVTDAESESTSTVFTKSVQFFIGADVSPLSKICLVAVIGDNLDTPFHFFISVLISDESRPNLTVASITGVPLC